MSAYMPSLDAFLEASMYVSGKAVRDTKHAHVQQRAPKPSVAQVWIRSTQLLYLLHNLDMHTREHLPSLNQVTRQPKHSLSDIELMLLSSSH